MSGFVKLNCDILDSSIMLEDADTFKAFIIFLASCNSEGIANVPPSSIVMRCKVSPERAMEILERLMAPDPLSKSKEEQGRRIVPYGDSGFHYRVVNYKKYREFTYSDNPEAVKKRRQRGGGEFTIISQSGLESVEVPLLGGRDIPGHVPGNDQKKGRVPTPLSSVPLSSCSNIPKENKETIKKECPVQEPSISTGKKPKREKKVNYECEHMDLAITLKQCIVASGTDMLLKESCLPDWANTFRLMMDADKRTVQQIEEKIKKVFEDPFWSKQIRSADKLRLRWNEGKLDNVGAKPKFQSSYAQQAQEEPEVDSRVEQERFTETRALNALVGAVEKYKNRLGEDGKKWREFFMYACPSGDNNEFLKWIWDMIIKNVPFSDVFETIHTRIKDFSGLTYDTYKADMDKTVFRVGTATTRSGS